MTIFEKIAARQIPAQIGYLALQAIDAVIESGFHTQQEPHEEGSVGDDERHQRAELSEIVHALVS